MKEHLQKLKGDKNMKERRRDPACGVSSPRSNITRAMWGRIPKEPNFYGLRNQLKIANPISQSALVIHASTFALQQLSTSTTSSSATRNLHSFGRIGRSQSYFCFEDSSANSEIREPPEKPRRAGAVESFQQTIASVVETLQSTVKQDPDNEKISSHWHCVISRLASLCISRSEDPKT